MPSQTFLITGASGYLGRRLVRRAGTEGTVYSASSTDGAVSAEAIAFDIADRDATLTAVVSLRPSVIIHAAAINPGQGDDDTMWRVNVTGSRNVAEAAVAVGARLVAVSTDVLHDGTAGPYTDDAPPTPINAYGRSKAEGEAAVLEIDPSTVAVRTSLMYGLDEMDRGTAGFAERLTNGETVRLFSDVLRNPIWVETLADALVRLAATDATGTLNIAGAEAVTREDYGRRMLAFWGIDTTRIEPIHAADMSNTIPLDVRLDSSKASSLLGIPFPGLTEILKR